MVMNARMTRMMKTTTPPATSGSGSLSGIAAKLSLPSMSISRLLNRHRHGCAGGLLGTRYSQVEDVLEEVRHDRAVGLRRHGCARLCQFGISRVVKRRPGAARLVDPSIEIA